MNRAPIERVDVSAYTVPTDGPEADGTLAWEATTVVVAEPVAGGRRGLGWSYTTAGAVAVIRDLLADAVVGREAFDVPSCYEAMRRAVRNIGRSGVAATAISALDVALWDLKARLAGVPLSALLGRRRGRVPVYGSGGFTTYDDDRTRAQLEHWAGDLGIPRVKIKIGESWGRAEARDLARVALARKIVGDEVELYVDANGAYRVTQAARVGHAMAEHDVRWFEEPVSSDDLGGLAELRARLPCEIAAGEYSWTEDDTRRLCEHRAVDCVQLDATRCGGVTGFLHGAAIAAAHHLDVSAHCAPLLHAPICLAVPNLRHIEYFHDHARLERMLFAGVEDPDDGALTVNHDAPGIGATLRSADAERYRVA